MDIQEMLNTPYADIPTEEKIGVLVLSVADLRKQVNLLIQLGELHQYLIENAGLRLDVLEEMLQPARDD
jgi:hypothetical protein